MDPLKNKTLCKLISLHLSLTIVLSMIPFSMMVYAATAEHPDSFTVSVKDEEENPLTDGKVVLTRSNDGWDLYLEAEIDENGLAVFDSTAIETAYQTAVEAGTIIEDNGVLVNTYAKVSGYTYGDTSVTFNSATAGSFTQHIELTLKKKLPNIDDVEIKANDLTYTGSEQELVSVTEVEGDTVEYYLGDSTVPTTDKPTATDAGTYSVRVVVTREGFAPLEKTVTVEIVPADIDLGELKIKANNQTFNGEEIPLLIVTNKGDYDLEYSIDNQTTWVKNDIPQKTNAGKYTVYVKATKEGHNDKETEAFPIEVTISKRPQSLKFADAAPSEITLGTNNEYNFATTGENFSGKNIEYSLIDGTATDIAQISAEGKLTVKKAGIITVKAFLAGNENYLDAITYKTIVIKNASTELVAFDTDSENYVLDEDGNVSEKTATLANTNDNGTLTYSIDNTNIGLTINPANGKITVNEEWKLIRAMWNNNGSVTVTVTVNKAEGSLEGKKWVFADGVWNSQNTNEKVYAADTDNYKILITFAEAPSFGDVCKIADPDPVSGWYNAEYPATITPIDATKYTIALDDAHWTNFGDSVTIKNQGSDTHYVFLKDKNTRQVSAPIAVDINVDTVKPDANRIKVEYAKSAMDRFLEVITLGFYNPSVTVRFTAYDETSGIDYFTWNYTKEDGASTINHPESVTGKKVDAVQDVTNKTKYTAEFTITADEANQYRGFLTVTATDIANNTSAVKEDSGNVFVIDTVNPEMSIKYEGAEPYVSEIDAIDNVHYFDGDVEVELTITEANFYSEDVTVVVTRDGQPYDYGTVNWGNRNAEDKTVGTFTLAGDGDYVVTVTATDKSGNAMVPYTSETITVDTKDPEISSVYDKEAQNITITIDEHNFRASDITVAVEALDINGKTVSVKDIQAYVQNEANWISNGDIRTLVLESTGENKMLVDAIYKLTINYMDISDNAAVTEVTESSLIDHTGPTNVKIEYAKSPSDVFLEVITLGFYNPSVTVRFTAYDLGAGVDYFIWDYTKEDGASTINHPNVAPEIISDAILTADKDEFDVSKFTATLELPAEEAAQYRGYFSCIAVDKYHNRSDKTKDTDNIVVVDNVSPTLSVSYNSPDRQIEIKENGQVIKTEYYYNNGIEVTLTMTEANFYPEDVVVKVTKDNEDFDFGEIAWGTRNDKDETVGTFTIPAPADHSGDGDYIITVEYTDRSGNGMEETYVSDTHTIDTTLPVINVEYQNTSVINKLTDNNGNTREYFADTQTAVITITEHNFIAEEVDFQIIAKDVTCKELDVSTLTGKTKWQDDENNADVHYITITYPGDANYTFDVEYADKATNKSADYAADYFTVDKTAPTNLRVQYSTSVLDTVLESLSFGFYNAKMTVTLTAEDATSEIHSFLYSYLNAKGVSSVNAQLVNEAIEAAAISYSNDRKIATVTFEIPKYVLKNDTQFNGTVEFTATDRANNVSEKHEETKRIVVDNISPKAQVTYNQATNVIGDVSYYDGNINATITINEANFYASDVQVMVSKDNGPAKAVTPSWKNNSVDVHVGTFTLTEDGEYKVFINYTDKSTNEMDSYTSNLMIIDTKLEAATYTINNEAKSGNSGAYKKDITVHFEYADPNFDTKTIELTRSRFDKPDDRLEDTFITVNETTDSGSGTFTIPSEVENDGIYVLKITVKDKALHEKTSEIKFIVNRYGSVYQYSDSLINLINDSYVTKISNDLVITEYNADKLIEDSSKILITRDGETVTLDPNTDIETTVNVDESGWYEYIYTIKPATFKNDAGDYSDGVYKISVSSKYSTIDSAENDSTSVPENSFNTAGQNIKDTINFTLDTIAPEIRNIINLDKKIAKVDKIVDGKLNVQYTIVDVGGLKTIEIFLNNQLVQTIAGEELAASAFNFNGSFDIMEQNGTKAQKVRIVVTDLAGNGINTDSKEFLKAHSADNESNTYVFFNEVTVSRNFFVRWYANKPLFWGSIVGTVVLAGAIWFIIAAKKKKKEEK